MPATKVVSVPVEGFRRLPEWGPKRRARRALFGWFGSPRGHPRLWLPRKQLLTTPSDTIVQVGTPNVGRVQQFACLTRSDVLIFEPKEENYERLREAAQAYDRVRIDPRGAAESHRTAEMMVSSRGDGDGRIPTDIGSEVTTDFDDVQEVELAPLDDLLAEHDLEPDFIEVMVNGAELSVLEGASQVLETVGPRLLLKSYGVGVLEDISHVDEMVTILEAHGYEVVTAPIRADVPHSGSPDGDLFAWK